LVHPPRPRPGAPILSAGAKPPMAAPRKPLPGGAATPTETIRQHIGIKPRTFTTPRPGAPSRPGGTSFRPPTGSRPAGPGCPPSGFRPRQPGSAPPTAEGAPAAARDHRGGNARPHGAYRAPQKIQEGKQDLRRGGRAPITTIARPAPFQPLPITKSITLTEGVSVKELAEKLDIKAKDIIKRLLDKGMFATLNQALDETLAIDLSHDF